MIRRAAFVTFLGVGLCASAIGQAGQERAAQEQGLQQGEPQQNEATETTQETQNPNAVNGGGHPVKQTENPQEPESHGTRLRWQDIPRNVLHDEKHIFISPFRINRDNAKYWIALGGITATFIGFDQKISDTMPQKTALTTPSKWASRIGADYAIYPLWASFYFVGKGGDNPRARDTARIGIEALIDADITANILKAVTQRPRPENKGDSVKFFTGGDAFPSGHSIKAWALARVAAREFPDSKLAPLLAYGGASAVSIARFGGRRHSASDAIAGAAMGFFIGDFVYRHHHAPSEKSKIAMWVADHVNLQFGDGVPPQLSGVFSPSEKSVITGEVVNSKIR